MTGFTYATLTTAIQDYTEVDSNVLTATITDQFIENAELKILRDVPIDAYKKQSIGNLVTGQTTINVPAKTLFVKGVQVYDSTSVSTGSNTWLEKKDETYLQEYIPAETSTGMPKYYAMFGGATGVTDPLQEDCSWLLHQMILMYLKFIMKQYQMVYLVQILQLILVNTFLMAYYMHV
jgi:hypothetical protein